MQVYEPLGPVAEFLSIIVALVRGGITSRSVTFGFIRARFPLLLRLDSSYSWP